MSIILVVMVVLAVFNIGFEFGRARGYVKGLEKSSEIVDDVAKEYGIK